MRSRQPVRLYHFTCDHGAKGIERDRAVVPLSLMPEAASKVDRIDVADRWLLDLAWFTDLPTPDRLEIGLTSHSISCDRLSHRFEVEPRGAIWWPVKMRDLRVPLARALSMTEGARPAHWWVASQPMRLLA